MRARPQSHYIVVVLSGLLSMPLAVADEPTTKQIEAKKGSDDTQKASATKPLITPMTPESARITPATEADEARERFATQSRLAELKDKPAMKPIAELINHRLGLLETWRTAHKQRLEAEKPAHSPESEAAEFRADLDKTRALIEQMKQSPDALLPEPFLVKDSESSKVHETKLVEMKEAIEAARSDLKEQTSQLETLRTESTRVLVAQVSTLRASRDKVFQGFTADNARFGERQASVASATSDEARELAREKFNNFLWEARIELEKLAEDEAKITLTNKRLELVSFQIQDKTARVALIRRLVERMEGRYSLIAERQRKELDNAVKKEVSLAASANDPLERRRAQRTAKLLELESQVVAYEKAFNTAATVSLQEQSTLADKATADYADLKMLVDDGTISPLDALRLKNDFRRIVPERAQIVRTDLAKSDQELTTYENALNDAEIDLVNDSRDDRFDRESFLEQLPAHRRGEAKTMLDELENRYRYLLNRRRDILRLLASRAEETNKSVLKRIDMLDQQYAFIRTHIFWIRDAEPLGASTLAHARDDSSRLASALVALAIETGDRNLWSRRSPEFILLVIALIVLPIPLVFGQKALDRFRLTTTAAPASALSLADYEPAGIDG